MENIPVVWLSYAEDTPANGYWDQGMIEEIFSNKMWNPVYDVRFIHYEKETFGLGGAVVVVPARSHTKLVDKINAYINTLDWVVLMLTGDEESVFPLEQIEHKNMIPYVMSPRPSKHKVEKVRFLGTGYPPQIHNKVDTEPPRKKVGWFFSGQVTHQRRIECVEQLRNMPNGILNETSGFTQGMPHEEYYKNMANAKVAPAPSGPETPDSFRLFEALELACVPIADTRVPKEDFPDDYWTYFFNEEPPFPVITTYEQLKGYTKSIIHNFPQNSNRVFAWWINYKRKLVYQVLEDIKTVSGKEFKTNSLKSNITVVIPTSPIISHPNIAIIEETIKSIRHHLPDCEIILTFDGIREEQENRRKAYEEFIRRILWKCNTEYKNVVPVIFEEHEHQTGMAREAISKYIKTPLLLYVEQDTPLRINKEIDWQGCQDTLLQGYADIIRFHHEAVIPKEHYSMLHGLIEYNDVDFIKTSQWSQRPHLASVAFYRRILTTCFSANAKSFIEDKMHGICSEAYLLDGLMGWENYRLLIYVPEEKDIKRSYHTDGRAGEKKYDDAQIF